ncbi:enoyl-CoA hydratase/isomerase family protein [Novosphingobium tardum]|uniref:Enoyl-CoA hydratase/isomerase family protein n=1 Tax=Novosphingobium tardum TaxID=1538021 RepID=A0ABV8RR07_9SPHN
MDGIDFLSTDRYSALGDCPVIVVPAADWRAPASPVQAVVIGIDAAGTLPPIEPDCFDILLTSASDAGAPWVCVPPDRIEEAADALAQAVRANPVAATVLAGVVRATAGIPANSAIAVESMAYSALLGGAEFRRWRERSVLPPAATGVGKVSCAYDEDGVVLSLASPETRNAMTAAMRDALYEALANTLDDPTRPFVTVRGAGRCFSSGGDLGEFGTATDLSLAHVIRTARSCAGALMALGERATVEFHGASIGSGLEIGAAAARRIARRGAWFQLPELRMGLIPGAGGTVTLPRAVGRHRTMWLALSGRRIGAEQALAWGLVREVRE